MGSLLGFVLNSALLGFGLAMDAFSVSVANGLNAPGMSRRWRLAIPLTFAGFQFLMPVIGWFCVRSIAEAFASFRPAIPWIALALLLFIGGKMLYEGIRGGSEEERESAAHVAPIAGYASFAFHGLTLHELLIGPSTRLVLAQDRFWLYEHAGQARFANLLEPHVDATVVWLVHEAPALTGHYGGAPTAAVAVGMLGVHVGHKANAVAEELGDDCVSVVPDALA